MDKYHHIPQTKRSIRIYIRDVLSLSYTPPHVLSDNVVRVDKICLH
jgi:hypothetical protein